MERNLSLNNQSNIKLKSKQKKDINNIIIRMEEEKIDLNGWELVEIPLERVYCFFNRNKNEAFDMEFCDEKNILVPCFHNEELTEGITQFEADSISSAINNYRLP